MNHYWQYQTEDGWCFCWRKEPERLDGHGGGAEQDAAHLPTKKEALGTPFFQRPRLHQLILKEGAIDET